MKISKVELGDKTSIIDGVLTIDKNVVDKAVLEDPLCKSLALDIIYPNERHRDTHARAIVIP